MNVATNRRNSPRLGLSYPIRLAGESDAHGGVSDGSRLGPGERSWRGERLGQSVTRDLSSRGAYFTTFDGGPFSVGQRVSVVISVPHRLAFGGDQVMLDLRGPGQVVRLEGARTHRTYGEDGLALTGVAVQFDGPLDFRYGWVCR